MADKRLLAILKKGTATWNTWMKRTREMRADLSEANLSGVDLRGVDLNLAYLRGANLRRANLTGANLWGVDFTWTDLSEVNLSWTDLSGADFRRANLTGATLMGADLTWADLRRANLTGANLLRTVLGDTNLTATEGLDRCNHMGPSTIDHRTLLKSGMLPLAFLRGCGVPESLIEYLPALLNQPIQFYPCFITYSSADQGFAERLHADLQDKGVRCWYAPEDMKIGDRMRERIDESIRMFDKLLLVFSEHSIRSQWVEQEVETALRKEREGKPTVLFPIRLDDAVMKADGGWPALIQTTRHIGDFRDWENHKKYQKAFKRLLRDLKSHEPNPGP